MAKGKRPDDRSGRPTKIRPVTAYLPESIFQALRRYAFEKDVKKSELLRRLLEEELRRNGYLKGKA